MILFQLISLLHLCLHLSFVSQYSKLLVSNFNKCPIIHILKYKKAISRFFPLRIGRWHLVLKQSVSHFLLNFTDTHVFLLPARGNDLILFPRVRVEPTTGTLTVRCNATVPRQPQFCSLPFFKNSKWEGNNNIVSCIHFAIFANHFNTTGLFWPFNIHNFFI